MLITISHKLSLIMALNPTYFLTAAMFLVIEIDMEIINPIMEENTGLFTYINVDKNTHLSI